MKSKYALLIFVLLIGCKEKSPDWPAESMAATEVEAANDLKLPESLWKKIAYEDSENQPPSGLYSFIPARIELIEKTPGVLKSSPVALQLTAGGGKIDLSQYLTGNQGTFYVRLRWNSELEDKDPRVYFVSNAKKRRLGDEVWGSGCNVYTDITQFYLKTLSKEGVAVNTTRARYVSLLSGSFVFAANDGKQVALSQITLTDSAHEQLLCQRDVENQ